MDKKLPENIDPSEKVCYNCKHLLWMIAIGQGLRCGHPDKTPRGQFVRSRRHTCEMFDPNKNKKNDKG